MTHSESADLAPGTQVYWLEPYEDEHTPSVVAEVKTGKVERVEDHFWVHVHLDGLFRGATKRLLLSEVVAAGGVGELVLSVRK